MLDKVKLYKEIESHVEEMERFDTNGDHHLKLTYAGSVIGLRNVLMLIDSGLFDKED